MAKLLKVTMLDGTTCYINPDYIVLMQRWTRPTSPNQAHTSLQVRGSISGSFDRELVIQESEGYVLDQLERL